MLEDRLSLPLKETATGKKFSFSRGALAVAGELLSHDAQSGAVVRMDKVEWDGTSICDSGTYTFPVEE